MAEQLIYEQINTLLAKLPPRQRNLWMRKASFSCGRCKKSFELLEDDYHDGEQITDQFCEGGCGRFYCWNCRQKDGTLCVNWAHCTECQKNLCKVQCDTCKKVCCGPNDIDNVRWLGFAWDCEGSSGRCVICENIHDQLKWRDSIPSICEKHLHTFEKYEKGSATFHCSHCHILNQMKSINQPNKAEQKSN